MAVKRYWCRNLLTDEEFVTNALNLQQLAQKTGIAKKHLQICKVWHRKNLDANSLILNY